MGVRIYLQNQGCLRQNLCRDRVEGVASIPFPSYGDGPPFSGKKVLLPEL